MRRGRGESVGEMREGRGGEESNNFSKQFSEDKLQMQMTREY